MSKHTIAVSVITDTELAESHQDQIGLFYEYEEEMAERGQFLYTKVFEDTDEGLETAFKFVPWIAEFEGVVDVNLSYARAESMIFMIDLTTAPEGDRQVWLDAIETASARTVHDGFRARASVEVEIEDPVNYVWWDTASQEPTDG